MAEASHLLPPTVCFCMLKVEHGEGQLWACWHGGRGLSMGDLWDNKIQCGAKANLRWLGQCIKGDNGPWGV